MSLEALNGVVTGPSWKTKQAGISSPTGRVVHPLAGLEPELTRPAAERAVIVPALTPTPGPAPAERHGVVTIETGEGPEGDYVDRLF